MPASRTFYGAVTSSDPGALGNTEHVRMTMNLVSFGGLFPPLLHIQVRPCAAPTRAVPARRMFALCSNPAFAEGQEAPGEV